MPTQKPSIMKFLEKLAFNFLLKRGYQVTLPMIHFTSGNNEIFSGATYWEPKKEYKSKNETKAVKNRSKTTKTSPITEEKHVKE